VEVVKSWGWPPDRIEAFDRDLGVHGSVPGTRGGFRWLLGEMRDDRVGLVMVADNDRLSRNRPDFAEFQETCADHGVLYAIQRQIIDYADDEGELVGNVLNATTVYQSKALFRRLRNAKVAKAKRGIAVTWPPVGYVASGGRWVKDPDPAVREVLGLIFAKIFEIGSGRALVRHLRRHNIRVPRRGRHGERVWSDATWSHLALFFHNEAYAGVYVYRKTRADHRLPRLKNGHHRTRKLSRAEWIRHQGHHEPYIDPSRWGALQALLQANSTVRNQSTPVGRGPTLSQRLLGCTVHGVTLSPSYSRHRERLANGQIVAAASYDCVRWFRERAETGGCMRLRARWVDQAIEREILRVLTPPRFDAVVAAVDETRHAYDVAYRSRQREVQRLEQIAAELQRQYVAVPDTESYLKERLRLQANEACRQHAEVVEEHRRQPLPPPIELDEGERERIRGLLAALPALWHHPAISFQQRKMLCRHVIRRIHLTPGGEAIHAEIEWASGLRTTLQLITQRGADAIIAQGLATGLGASAIAEQLNAAGALRRNRLERHTAASVRSRARVLGVPPPSIAACEAIKAAILAGRTLPAIAAELTGKGLEHRLGAWTPGHVLGAIKQMRAGKVPGFEAVPPLARPPRARDEIARLWNETHDEREVARRLSDVGRRSRRKRAYTTSAVRHELSMMRGPRPSEGGPGSTGAL
jgi:DNA invertase Pin-like site-specific DNA recombinase